MSLGSRLLRIVPLLLAFGAPAAHGGSPQQALPAREPGRERAFTRQDPFVVRPFRPFIGTRWIGDAIAYGPHRDGQRPGGPSPTRAEVREDLRLMSKRWNLLRIYGSVGPPDSILAVIREDRLAMKVMLGVWIEPEERRDSTGRILERLPEAKAANRAEIESAIRLANAYPQVVIAVSVGNETQVSWSSHRVPTPLLTGYIREVRARTRAPVTTADDFNFWNKPESGALASELDLIVTHIHPLWGGQQIEGAPDWTRSSFEGVRVAHPGRTVVIGETGWATRKLATGEQGTLMKGQVGEEQQSSFCNAFAAWAKREKVATFFFEAFDENWKGGTEPDDAEKHWGFFRADRTPKRVLNATD